MKNTQRKLLTLSLVIVLLFCSVAPCVAFAEEAVAPSGSEDGLTNEQRNAIAMLNYVAVLTQEINSSQNNQFLLEKAYNLLLNNIYPNSVDVDTQAQITQLLDTMQAYRMLAVQRDRLSRAYDRDLIFSVLDELFAEGGCFSEITLGLLFTSPKTIITIVSGDISVSSIYNFVRGYGDTDPEYLNGNWALDDEASDALHICRTQAFNYMVTMVQTYKIPGDAVLTEARVEEFVKWKNNPNVTSRIQYLESNREVYRYYGGYWLVLAASYYEAGDYEKCISAVEAYEEMEIRIFRKDYEYAQVLPIAIASAEKALPEFGYIRFASKHVQLLMDNTEDKDWALRYYAAQTCLDLYNRTKDKDYLDQAYTIVLNSTNYLAREQGHLNEVYLKEVQEVPAPDTATKRQKDEINAYNKQLKNDRKTELPPVSEPLILNLELLLNLAEMRQISDSDREHLDSMFRDDNGSAPLLLSDSLDARYRFASGAQAPEHQSDELVFSGDSIEIPAVLLSSDAVITVYVYAPGEDEPVLITDWKIEKVSRSGEGLSGFVAEYSSEEGDDYPWASGTRMAVEITPCDGVDLHSIFYFKVYDSGASWYEVWEDSFSFMPVSGIESGAFSDLHPNNEIP